MTTNKTPSPEVRRAEATSLVFYTVQSEADRQRLRGGGEPWPDGLPRAVFGPGLYCWESLGQATFYEGRLRSRGIQGLAVLALSIERVTYGTLRTVDLTVLSDADRDQWLDVYSEYTTRPPRTPHGYEHVIRETYNVGREFYFSPSTFGQFRAAAGDGGVPSHGAV